MNRKCKFIWYDDEDNHIIDIDGELVEVEYDASPSFARNITIKMVQTGYCKPYEPSVFEDKEESDEMSVKIKKPVKEISIDELKKGIEFEELKITIDGSKKDTIEKQSGLKYNYPNEIIVCDGEILFTDYIMEVHNHGYYPIPYDIIEKLEVREC